MASCWLPVVRTTRSRSGRWRTGAKLPRSCTPHCSIGTTSRPSFSTDGTTLAFADVSVKFWASPSWTLQRTAAIGDGTLLETVAFSPDGRLLAVANGGHGVDLLDSATGAVVRTLK